MSKACVDEKLKIYGLLSCQLIDLGHVAMTKQYMFLIQSSRSAKEPIQLPKYKEILLPPFLQSFYSNSLAHALKASMIFISKLRISFVISQFLLPKDLEIE